jgi:hypothetical protein
VPKQANITSEQALSDLEFSTIKKYVDNMEYALALNLKLRVAASEDGARIENAIIQKGLTTTSLTRLYRRVSALHNSVEDFQSDDGIALQQSSIISTADVPWVTLYWSGKFTYTILVPPGERYIAAEHLDATSGKTFQEYLLAPGKFVYFKQLAPVQQALQGSLTVVYFRLTDPKDWAQLIRAEIEGPPKKKAPVATRPAMPDSQTIRNSIADDIEDQYPELADYLRQPRRGVLV